MMKRLSGLYLSFLYNHHILFEDHMLGSWQVTGNKQHLSRSNEPLFAIKFMMRSRAPFNNIDN